MEEPEHKCEKVEGVKCIVWKYDHDQTREQRQEVSQFLLTLALFLKILTLHEK